MTPKQVPTPTFSLAALGLGAGLETPRAIGLGSFSSQALLLPVIRPEGEATPALHFRTRGLAAARSAPLPEELDPATADGAVSPKRFSVLMRKLASRPPGWHRSCDPDENGAPPCPDSPSSPESPPETPRSHALSLP